MLKQRMDGRAMLAWTLALALAAACGGTDGGGRNQPPVAQAGVDQSVATGASVALDGSASNDPDGDTITYQWTLSAMPAGSTARLSDPAAPRPTFTSDRDGVYQADLVVHDGRMDSAMDSVTITAARPNARPQAAAGADRTVQLGSVVSLDASSSSDPDGDKLTVVWSFAEKPAGSKAGIKDSAAVRTLFVADTVGEFRVSLIVSDGRLTSDADTAVITVVDNNTPPRANAGPDQSVSLGTVVQLDGGASVDDDGDPLTYRWSFVSKPAGSNAGIKDPASAHTLFVADTEGQFVVQLIVDDGRDASAPDVLVVTTTKHNAAPVAKAGDDQDVEVGATVVLDGGASTDADHDVLGYAWTLVSRPDGSAAEIGQQDAAQASFVADVEGQYTVRLVVNDGQAQSAPDTMIVTAGGDGGGTGGCSNAQGAELCDSLNGSTEGSENGGDFVHGGWTPGWNIRWDLGHSLSQGAFSADLDNFDPSENSPQHQYDKQQILSMYEDSSGDEHKMGDTRTSGWATRTGAGYNGLFKFWCATNGFDDRTESRISPPGGRVDPHVTHTVRVEWNGGNCDVFLDGDHLNGQGGHSGRFALRYVFVGSDNSGGAYGPQADVIYKNVKVWGSTGGGRMVAANLNVLDGKPVVTDFATPKVGGGLLDWLRARTTPLAATLRSMPVLAVR